MDSFEAGAETAPARDKGAETLVFSAKDSALRAVRIEELREKIIEERPFVLGVCEKLSRRAGNANRLLNTPEDLAQETIMSAVMHADQFKEKSELRAWLYAIALNVWRMDFRRKQSDVVANGISMEEDERNIPRRDAVGLSRNTPSFEGAAIAHFDIEKARESLSPMNRELLDMLLQGGEREDIMKRFGIPKGTAKSRINSLWVQLGRFFFPEERVPRSGIKRFFVGRGERGRTNK